MGRLQIRLAAAGNSGRDTSLSAADTRSTTIPPTLPTHWDPGGRRGLTYGWCPLICFLSKGEDYFAEGISRWCNGCLGAPVKKHQLTFLVSPPSARCMPSRSWPDCDKKDQPAVFIGKRVSCGYDTTIVHPKKLLLYLFSHFYLAFSC